MTEQENSKEEIAEQENAPAEEKELFRDRDSFRGEAPAEQANLRLDRWLVEKLADFSRSQWQRTVSAGEVQVNGLAAKPAHRLHAGDIISGKFPQERKTEIVPTAIDLKFIYEDEHLIVVDKPANLIVHPGKANYSGTLANALVHHFETLSQAGGEHRPGIVHRLDRDTTGVIVIARNNAVHENISKQFADRTVEKEYRAICWGEADFDSDYIETHIRSQIRNRERMVVCSPNPEAREATTYYEVIKRYRSFTYFKLLPKTGRTHQLRVHLQHIRHPVVADRIYGGRAKLSLSDLIESKEHFEGDRVLISRQALHAHRLCIDHPHTGKRMEFISPIPEDFQSVLDALEEHCSTK